MIGDDRLVEVEATFGRIWSFRNDVITDQIVKFGAHTRPDLAFLLSVVCPGDPVFDLGGHIGTFAIPLAQKIGEGGRLLVVEGNRTNFQVLSRNMERMQLRAETQLLNALVAMPGRRYAPQMLEHNSGGTWFSPADGAGVEIETVTIDELCRRYFTPRVLKIDIEGWELFALNSSELLKRQHPVVYAEINETVLNQQGATVAELDQLFRSSGYRLFCNVGGRNAAHDNFVVAELATLKERGRFFDVLAIHSADERLADVATQ